MKAYSIMHASIRYPHTSIVMAPKLIVLPLAAPTSELVRADCSLAVSVDKRVTSSAVSSLSKNANS